VGDSVSAFKYLVVFGEDRLKGKPIGAGLAGHTFGAAGFRGDAAETAELATDDASEDKGRRYGEGYFLGKGKGKADLFIG
jgi:hypothetical protein